MDKLGAIYLDSLLFENICLAAGGNIGQTNYFFTKKKGLWGLHRSPNNKELIPPIYIKLEPAGHTGYYKAKQQWDQDWILIDTTNRQIFPTTFEDVVVLNEKSLAIQQDLKWQIYTRKQQQFEKEDLPYANLRKINKHLVLLEQFTNEEKKKVLLKNTDPL